MYFNKKKTKGRLNEKKNLDTCGVCGNTDGKYKCPKCRLRYCSVKCCKEHRSECQNNNVALTTLESKKGNDTSQAGEKEQFSRYLPSDALTKDPLECAIKRRKILDEEEEKEEEGWKITREMMDKLDNSTWLKEELADGGLRQLIAEIDSADCHDDDHVTNHRRKKERVLRNNNTNTLTPREIALARAKLHNANFAKFIDQMLLTAGVIQHVNYDWDTEEILNKLISGDATLDDVGALRLVPIQKKKKLDIIDNIASSTRDSDSSEVDGSDVSSSEESDV